MPASTRSLALAAAAAVTFHAAPAAADKARFVFTALAPPGGAGPVFLAGVYHNQAVGNYSMANGYSAGFVWSEGKYISIPAVNGFSALSSNGLAVGKTAGSYLSYTTYKLATGAMQILNFGPTDTPDFSIGGANSTGNIAATQFTKDKHNTACQPFEQSADGSYNWLAQAKVRGLIAIGLTDDNVVVMERQCGSDYKYVLYSNGKQKTFAIPGATDIEINFVDGAGFGGSFLDGNNQVVGYLAAGKKLAVTTYPLPPGFISIDVSAIGPHNEVAGYLLDPSGYFHGFIYEHNTYYTIDYPKQKSTIITGFSATGAIVGYFGDNDFNYGLPGSPFVATCAPDKGCVR